MSVIFFDLDDTLYERALPFIRAYSILLEGRYADRAKAAAAACMQRSVETQAEAEAGLITYDQMPVRRFCLGMADVGITISEAEAAKLNSLYEESQQLICLSGTMRHCLDLCGSMYDRIGIMTNGVPEKQRWKISLLGLERWADPKLIIISGECGFLKPDRRAYLLAQQLSDASGDEITIVGDSYASDLRSAIEFGWHTIWLNRSASELPMDALAPDFEVRSEEAFAELLEKKLH